MGQKAFLKYKIKNILMVFLTFWCYTKRKGEIYLFSPLVEEL